MIPPPRLRRIKLTLIALGLVLAAMVWLLARPAPAGAGLEPAHARPIPLSDIDPWGANFFLEEEVEAWNIDQTLAWAEEAGIRWAKQHFRWYEIERTPGEFHWEKYDSIVDQYRARGIEVVARLDFPAAWVEPAPWVPAEKRGPPLNTPPADPEVFARFVAATVRHFQGRVRFYQIWNEPNLFAEWGFNPEHPANPDEYVALLAAASRAARAADPQAVILTAPLAFTTEGVELRGNMSDLDYLRGMYRAGAAAHFDVLSANAFGMEEPPEAEPAEDRLNFRRLELQRGIMEEAGDRCKPIWAAEYGWNAAPEGVPSIWGSVSEADQAEWTVGGLAYGQRSWPWLGMLSIWYFRHPRRTDDEAVYYFQMVDEAFRRRRLYTAVAAAAAPPAVAGPGEWAERSAPVRLARLADWDWLWDAPPGARGARRGACLGIDCCRAPDARAADYRYLASDHAGARLELRFRGSSLAVRARPLSQVASFEARVDGEARTVFLSEREGWAWKTLAEGVADREHRLELELGEAGGRVAIDGFRVEAGGVGDPRRPWALGLTGLALGLGLLLVIDLRAVAGRIRV